MKVHQIDFSQIENDCLPIYYYLNIKKLTLFFSFLNTFHLDVYFIHRILLPRPKCKVVKIDEVTMKFYKVPSYNIFFCRERLPICNPSNPKSLERALHLSLLTLLTMLQYNHCVWISKNSIYHGQTALTMNFQRIRYQLNSEPKWQCPTCICDHKLFVPLFNLWLYLFKTHKF